MRQLFFVSDTPITQYPQLMGATFHVWTDSGHSVGVVNMDGDCDSDKVISALESAGYSWMPNHFGIDPIGTDCAQCLGSYGVLATDTTVTAMTKIHAAAGFPPLKPRKF